MLQNKRSQRGPYSSNQPYHSIPTPGMYGQQPPPALPPTPASNNANVADMISSLDGPSLQKLLGAMQQQQQQHLPPAQPPPPAAAMHQPPINMGSPGINGTADIAGLLTSVARQQQQQQQQNLSGQPASAQRSFSSTSGQTYPGSGQYDGNQQPPPNMQNLMDQLTRYRK